MAAKYIFILITSYYLMVYRQLCSNMLMQLLPPTLPLSELVTHSIFPCWMRGCGWLLVTEWREGWRPSNKEGYRGHNMAAPLSRGIKVGQSVPWMISNSTFWGPIH